MYIGRVICKILDMDKYPDTGEISRAFKTHKLDDLIKLAGLDKKFTEEKKKNFTLYTNWSIVTKWSENYRYNPIGTNLKQSTKDIIEALEEPKDGVFTWIVKWW